MRSPVETKTATRAGDPLQTKYYCRTEKQNMNVVMELKPTMKEGTKRLPLRYVLLIDVSGSMDTQVGLTQQTLLSRVQVFADLAVRKVSENDWLSIVTFSDDARIEMSMLPMVRTNKLEARKTIRSLTTRGSTNLEKGIESALESIQRAPKLNYFSRDCIILFTDGAANEGETDPKRLIEKYNHIQESMNTRSCIPVSAFTIGGYRPDLLIEISRHLGSDSFYWLNDEQDFESDMLIPLFLREVTNITDVDIRIDAQANCYFEPVDTNAAHLKEIQMSKVQIKQENARNIVDAPTTQCYFIHSLPDAMSKNLTFNLELSDLQDLRNEKIVDITIHYLDCELNPRTIHDHIVLSTASNTPDDQHGRRGSQFLFSHEYFHVEFHYYTVYESHVNSSWSGVQDAIIKIAEEKCKYISVNTIEKAKSFYNGENPQEINDMFQRAFLEINAIRSHTQRILQQDEEISIRASRLIDQWTQTLYEASEIVATKDERNFAKLASMASSITMESPTAGGIFKEEQPFMNIVLQNKLEEEQSNLEFIRRLHVRGVADVEISKSGVIQAIKTGDLARMESYYLDLKGWKLLDEDVEEMFIEYVAKEIEHRKRLEQIKTNLEVSLKNEHSQNVSDLAFKLEELRKIPNLTFLQADANSLKQATDALALYQLKEKLRKEIQQQMPFLNAEMVPKNMDVIATAIQALVQLRDKSKDMQNVFSEQDSENLDKAIAKHRTVSTQIESLTTKMNELARTLHLSRHPSNYTAVIQAITEMENVKKLVEEEFDGLFTKKQEQALRTGIKSREAMEVEKQKMQKRLKEILAVLRLPSIAKNYIILKDAVNEAVNIKQLSEGFGDVFLEEHEASLNEAIKKLEMLLAKKNDIAKKISENLSNAMLPMEARNFGKIKSSVRVLLLLKQEADGFEDVFTKEHDEILENGLTSVKTLESEKNEIMKQESECVSQLQLPMLPANLIQITNGIDTMGQISAALKDFELYEEKYDSYYNQAVINRDTLNEKKQQIIADIQFAKVNLKISLSPENLPTLRTAVDEILALKNQAQGFDNVFSRDNEIELFEATMNLEQLSKNVKKMNITRQILRDAVEKRDFTELKRAVKTASHSPFIKKDELAEPRKLVTFLDPEKRCTAVKNAIEEQDSSLIIEALLDMRKAGVVNDALEEQATAAIKKLQKRKRKEERDVRRTEKLKRRRNRALQRLDANLREAIESRDLEILEQSIIELDGSEFKDEEVPSAIEARDLLWKLNIDRTRERLKEGIRTRDIDILSSAVMDVKYGKYEEYMKEEYAEAESLLAHLREMMRLREEIAKMTRASIAEVHSYSTPPEPVIKIMRAFFIILGENPKDLTWQKLQILMGKLDRNSIKNRVKRFRMEDLSETASKKAAIYLEDLDLDEVEGVSKEAATLFAWAKYVVIEMENFRKTEEKHKGGEKDPTTKTYEEEFESEEENISSDDA